MDIRDLDRRAIDSTGGIVDKLTDDQFDLPTPCAKWTVGELVDHLISNNHRIVAKLTGEERAPTGDRRRDYRASADALTAAFADDAAMSVLFEMPLVGRDVDGRTALTVHFADVFVHGWDLARAIGADLALDPELVAAVTATVSRYPDAPGVWAEDGTVFAPRIEVAADADPLSRLLALTGRDQGWTAP